MPNTMNAILLNTPLKDRLNVKNDERSVHRQSGDHESQQTSGCRVSIQKVSALGRSLVLREVSGLREIINKEREAAF